MFTDTINKCAANAARIARLSANNPLGFWVSSAMAGAYVGLGKIGRASCRERVLLWV